MDKQSQDMFLDFILQRIQEGKEEEAKEILLANFKKQAEGTFSLSEIQEFIPKIISLLKPDKLDEVKGVVMQFAEKFVNK